MDPLNALLNQMLLQLAEEASAICEKYGLNKEDVESLAYTCKSFDEFSEALDKMIEKQKNSEN